MSMDTLSLPKIILGNVVIQMNRTKGESQFGFLLWSYKLWQKFFSNSSADVLISSYQDMATKAWKNVESDDYSTILSNMDGKGVVSTIVVIEKTQSSHLTGKITFASCCYIL